MSEQITIKELLDLKQILFTTMSDITLEATVKEVRQAYGREVKSGERKGQSFWSQKIIIQDNTGSIVIDYIAGKMEDTVPQTAIGKKIRIEKAKTDIYKDERRLARGKVTLLESAKQPSGGNGYDTLPDGRAVVSREVWEAKDRLITKTAITKSLIEAGRKWGKAVEKEADGWLGWVYNSKPEDESNLKPPEFKKPKPAETEGLVKVMDKDFNRDQLIKRLGKRFAELFVGGKTKGLGLEEWLSKNYEVKSFMGLSDDYLVELDTVFNDMEGKK